MRRQAGTQAGTRAGTVLVGALALAAAAGPMTGSAAAGAAAPTTASGAAAAPTVTRTTGCSTDAATIRVVLTVERAGGHGTLRFVQGTPEGEFTDEPAMTVRVRDGAGRLVAVRRSTDGSLSVPFAMRLGGPFWTAQATITNTADGACSTPRVRVGLR